MEIESLAEALEREHREIDEGIEAFTAATPDGDGDRDRDQRPLARAIRALRRHIYLEEEFLFPPLRKAGMVAPLFVMLREHGQIWNTLDVLERQLRAGSAGSAEVLLCHQLTSQLRHHNLKEERIVYPGADRALTASASARLRAFLDSGELPEGWVCQKARP